MGLNVLQNGTILGNSYILILNSKVINKIISLINLSYKLDKITVND